MPAQGRAPSAAGRHLLSYLGLVVLPALLVPLLLHAGRALRAPPQLAGTWRPEEPTPGLDSLRVAQSGRWLELRAYPGGRASAVLEAGGRRFHARPGGPCPAAALAVELDGAARPALLRTTLTGPAPACLPLRLRLRRAGVQP